jgi:hypothetical protein
MDKGDRYRPFADCRRHTLEATSADVADREHPGQTRFQEILQTVRWLRLIVMGFSGFK